MTSGLQADILTDKVQKKGDSFNTREILIIFEKWYTDNTDWYLKSNSTKELSDILFKSTRFDPADGWK